MSNRSDLNKKIELDSGPDHNLAAELLRIFNPTGKAVAAAANAKGFFPVCKNFRNKAAGCRFGKGIVKPCTGCEAKDYIPLSLRHIREHLAGKKRYGVYPLLDGNRTSWVAADFDNHNGDRDPESDVRALVAVADVFGLPVYVFSSNSGNGFHAYLFFKEPIPAVKARALMRALIDRAGHTGSFDRLFPAQDSKGSLGNLIALPFSGKASNLRNSTLYVIQF